MGPSATSGPADAGKPSGAVSVRPPCANQSVTGLRHENAGGNGTRHARPTLNSPLHRKRVVSMSIARLTDMALSRAIVLLPKRKAAGEPRPSGCVEEASECDAYL